MVEYTDDVRLGELCERVAEHGLLHAVMREGVMTPWVRIPLLSTIWVALLLADRQGL